MAMLNNQRVYIYITSILIQEFWGTRNAIMDPGIQMLFPGFGAPSRAIAFEPLVNRKVAEKTMVYGRYNCS